MEVGQVLPGFRDSPDWPREGHPIAIQLKAGGTTHAVPRGEVFEEIDFVRNNQGGLDPRETGRYFRPEEIDLWSPIRVIRTTAQEDAEREIIELVREVESAANGWQVVAIKIFQFEARGKTPATVGGSAVKKCVAGGVPPLNERWNHVNPRLCEILERLQARQPWRVFAGEGASGVEYPIERRDGIAESINLTLV